MSLDFCKFKRTVSKNRISVTYNQKTIYEDTMTSNNPARKMEEALREKSELQYAKSMAENANEFLLEYKAAEQSHQDEDDYVFDYSTELGEFNTSGGEFCLDESYEAEDNYWAEDNYCLDFNGEKYSLSVQNIPSKELKKICKQIFDHLAANGHRAKIEKIHQDGPELTWDK